MAFIGKKGGFTVKSDSIDKLMASWKKELVKIDQATIRKMNSAVGLVFSVARARRPKVGKKKGEKGYRVSDPNAEYGVPVDTGTLRSAIKKEVKLFRGGKVQGKVWVDLGVAPYGKYIEFGTSRIQARPFLRPALLLNRENIKRIFGAPE